MGRTWHNRRWQALGSSVTGALHRRLGRPNQDALLLPDVTTDELLLLAVADGHGNSLSFRSDRGARLAVTTARAVCHWALTRVYRADPAAFQNWVTDQLPLQLVRHWREQVECDVAAYPFGPAEQRVQFNSGYQFAYPYLAYGATLLVVAVTMSFILYLQLGDGDILTVDDAGQVRRPLPQDARLFANMTTSLCTEDAWECVRVAIEVPGAAPPALILAATDGYANSYQDDAGFLQVGSDLLHILRTDGPGQIEQHLAGWLNLTSQGGSGDDITVGLLYRLDPATEGPVDADPTAPTIG